MRNFLQKLTGAVLLFLAGCVALSADFAPSHLSQGFAPRTPPAEIELFRSQVPTKKFTEVGAVTICCNGGSNYQIDLLRKAAAENGGDALIALDVDATGRASASVIRYDR